MDSSFYPSVNDYSVQSNTQKRDLQPRGGQDADVPRERQVQGRGRQDRTSLHQGLDRKDKDYHKAAQYKRGQPGITL